MNLIVKTKIILLLGGLLTASLCDASDSPSWKVSNVERISLVEWRSIHTNGQDEQIARTFADTKPQSFAIEAESSNAESDVSVAPVSLDLKQLARLARALEYDPQRMYFYIRNRFDYIPYFGFLKGAVQTHFDYSGNDFDQAYLLLRLLNGSRSKNPDIEAATMYAMEVDLNLQEISAWLACEDDTTVVETILDTNGIPFETIGDIFRVSTYGIETIINGETVDLWPAYKVYESSANLDYQNISEVVISDLIAQLGGTSGTDWIESVNQDSLDSYLTEATGQIEAHLENNYFNATSSEVLRSSSIVEDRSFGMDGFTYSKVAAVDFDNFPRSLTYQISFQFAGINRTLILPEIAGRKLVAAFENTVDEVIFDESPALAIAFTESGDEGYKVTPATKNVASSDSTQDFLGAAKLPKDFELQTESPQISVQSVPSGTPDQTFNRTFTVFREAQNRSTTVAFSVPRDGILSPYTVELEWQTNPGGAFSYGEIDFFSIPGRGSFTANVTYDPTKDPDPNGSNAVLRAFVDPQGVLYNNLLLQVNFSVDVINDPIEISQPNGDPVVTENTESTASFLITNTGDSEASVSNLRFTGDDAGSFENISPSSFSLSPGESQEVSYDIKPLESGTYTVLIEGDSGIQGLNGQITFGAPVFVAPTARMQLYIDDQLVFNELGSNPLDAQALNIRVTRPGGQFTDNEYGVARGGLYYVATDFGSGRNYRLREAQRQLSEYQENYASDSNEVMTQALEVFGLTWMQQTAQHKQLLDSVAEIQTVYLHRVGLVVQEDAYYIDVKDQLSTATPLTSSISQEDARKISISSIFLYSALEDSIWRQLQQETEPVSTVELFRQINESGGRFYFANADNWETIESELTGYSENELTVIGTGIDSGFSYILPANGDIELNAWNGSAYFEYDLDFLEDSSLSISAKIGGRYDGGYNSFIGPLQPLDVRYRGDFILTPEGNVPTPLSAEPVNLYTGAYESFLDLLTIGGEAPLGIHFKITYDNQNRNATTLGQGWTHNWQARIREQTNSGFAFGERRPVEASAQILYATVLREIQLIEDQDDPKLWLLRTLAANWAKDQLEDNMVSVRADGKELAYSRKSDGTLTPPPGSPNTLNFDGENYIYQERLGDTLVFEPTEDDFRLATWTNVFNQTLTVAYANDLVCSVTDAFGRPFTFNYDGDFLSSVSDDYGRHVDFGYTGDDLTSYTTATDHTYRFEYDSHNIIRWVNPDGETIAENRYNDFWQVYEQLSEGENLWKFFYTDFEVIEEDPTGAQKHYFYDSQGLVKGFEDAEENLSLSEFNGHNLIVRSVNPRGFETLYEFDNRLNRTSTRRYFTEEDRYLSVTMTHDDQNRVETVTDESNETTTFTYTPEHLVETITNPLSGTSTNLWNSNGTLSQRTNFNGQVTQYPEYDSYQNPIRIIYGDLTEESFTYHPIGYLESRIDGKNQTTSYTYDNNLNRLTVRRPDGGTTTNTYRFSDDIETVTTPKGNTTTFRYSALDKLVEVEDPYREITKTYYNLQDVPETVETPLGFTSTTIYDRARRSIGSRNALNFLTSFEFDPNGNVELVRDHLNNETTSVFDSLDRRLGSTNPRSETTSNDYNDSGTRTSFTDANGESYIFRPDNLQRFEELETPLGKVFATDYFPGGQIETITKPSGEQIEFTYTGTNQVATIVDSIATREFGYDLNRNLVSITEGDRSLTYRHDELDRVNYYRNEYGDEIRYVFDLNGNLVTKEYPGGNRAVSYTYDLLNRLETVTDWFGNVTTFFYDIDSRLTEIQLPNGTSRTFVYDPLNRITERRDYDSTGYTLFWEVYTWDEINRLTNIQTFPIVEEVTPASVSLENNGDNEVEKFNGQPVTYNSDGNLALGPLPASEGLFDYTFNARDQLTSVGASSYVYGIEGHRIELTNEGVTSRFIVDPAGALTQSLGIEKNGITTWYVHGGDLLYELNAAGEPITYHYNYQGSTVAMVAPDGESVLFRAAYSPYGESYVTESYDTPFLFNGAMGIITDPNGLISMRARYYDPTHTKRFISIDPIKFEGGNNWYQFAAGSPLVLGDITGLGVSDYTPGGFFSSMHGSVQNAYNSATNFDDLVLSPYTTTIDAVSRFSANLSSGISGAFNLASANSLSSQFALAVDNVGNGISNQFNRAADFLDRSIVGAFNDSSSIDSISSNQFFQNFNKVAGSVSDGIGVVSLGVDYYNAQTNPSVSTGLDYLSSLAGYSGAATGNLPLAVGSSAFSFGKTFSDVTPFGVAAGYYWARYVGGLTEEQALQAIADTE